MGNKKILIIGAKDFPKASCYDWGEKELNNINIPDYDVAIVNLVSLPNNILEFHLQEKINEGIETLLDTGGSLVAIGCPETNIKVCTIAYPSKRVTSQSNYMWCPIPIKIKNESGTSFKFEDETFKEYFKNVKKWKYCFNIPSHYRDENVGLGISHFVRNRYGKYLGGVINYFIPEVRWKSGDFIFLPYPTEISDIEAINFILEKYFKIYQKTPLPDWTKSIQVPGLDEIRQCIEANLEKIKKLSDENEILREKKFELLSYIELLYETGTALEKIVRNVLTLLEYKPIPPNYKEEYIIKYNKKIGVIECKGNEKSIKRDDFRQLLEHTKEYELDGKFEAKGILIGNAWRLRPLEERDKSGTVIFPKGKDGVTKIAERHDIALVSTIDLFKVFCRFLEGKIKGKEIMKKIFSSKGIVKFDK